MVFELVGSRVLGPYFGTSIFVWTSLIGIILGSLSFGYFLGGKVADKKPNIEMLALVIFLSAIFIGLTLIIKDFFLVYLKATIPDIKISSIIATIVLFSPTSILLGMVSPYAAKLKLLNLEISGATIGNLYAISTAGSIVGTFLSGFYLIPKFGTNKLLIILTITLITVSLFLSAKKALKIKFLVFALMLAGWFIFDGVNNALAQKGFIDVDTSYSRVWIYEIFDKNANDTIRTFSINSEHSSAMYLNSNNMVYEYAKYYHLAKHFNPGFQKTLMLGGAGYSYPKEFLLKYPEATIDVVEIDPMITELAKKYFKLKDDPRLTIYHKDGRVYLNETKNKYDVIFGDAFSSQYSLPYQLTTKEAVQKKFDALEENGIVVLNIISSIKGEKGKFLRAEYATYKSVFPQVFLFPVSAPTNGYQVQNIILVALKSDEEQVFSSENPDIDSYLKHRWTEKITEDMPILTDDFAPVDYYISKTI